MNFIIRYIILVLAILFSSCQPILMTLAGMKKPAKEDYDSCLQFLEDNDIQAEKLFCVSEEEWLEVTYGRSLPEYMLFDSNGSLIVQSDLCFPDNQDYFDLLIETSTLDDSTYHLQFDYFSNRVHSFDGQKISIIKSDYNLVILWCVFGGKKLARQIKNIIALSNKSKHNISIALINIDQQTFWNETDFDLSKQDSIYMARNQDVTF